MNTRTMLTIHEFRPIVLRLMGDKQIRTKTQIVQDARNLAKLDEQALAESLPSGQNRAAHRIGWAISSLVKAGLLERLSQATYQASPLGLETGIKWQQKNIRCVSDRELKGFEQWDKYQQSLLERKRNSDGLRVFETGQDNEENETPDLVAADAVKKIEDEVAVELLERLRAQSPRFFELAVINVLLAMGYGGKENLHEHVGRSHDGGIDGVIKQDPLGIQNIYIQAKRYAEGNTVGSRETQSFVGALQGNGVERGVFITASSFTVQAKEYAQKLLGRVVLIDGQHLATLMIRYKVGIQTKQTLEIIELDEDFFTE